MAGDSFVQLSSNIGVGAQAAVYVDASGFVWQKVVLGLEGGFAVSNSNPVPVAQVGTFTVGLSGAIPAGANTIGAVTQGGSWTVAATQSGTWTVTVNALPSGSNTIGAVKVTDGTNFASLLSLTNAKPITVAIVDGNGNQITAFGGTGGTSLQDAAAFTRGTTFETPIGGVVEASNPTLTAGKAGALSLDTSGNLRVVAANSISAGTPAAPSSGVLSVQPPLTTPTHVVSAASTNATNVTSAAGWVKVSSFANNSATNWAYLKIYDKASAPVPGTDTPVALYPLPPNGGSNPGDVIHISTGFGYAITGGIADSDATAVAANQVGGTFVHT